MTQGPRKTVTDPGREPYAASRLGSLLYRFLLESELPVALQVSWKLLLFGMTAMIAVEVIPRVSIGGQIILSILAACFFVAGVFLKLGEG